jgi:hypothetical protein
VTLQLIPQGNRTILRKTVPAAFLQQAVFPVKTDHPTNYTIGTGDGYCGVSEGSWNNAHDHTGEAGFTDDSGTNNWCWTYYTGSAYRIYRTFLPVDTSGVSGTVSAAVLYLYCTEHVDPGGSNFFRLVETTQPDTSQVQWPDYDTCAAVDNPTSGGELDDGDVTAPSDWSSLTLNATGLTYINDAGWSKLGLRESQDAVDSWSDGAHKLVWNSSDNASNNPYVDVTASSTKGPPAQAVIIS